MLALLTAAFLHLHLDRIQESLTGPHYHYQAYVDGVPLLNEAVILSRAAGEGPVAETASRTAHDDTLFALRVDGAIRFVRKTIVQERPLEPYAEFRDVDTNELLRRVPLFWTAKARVFAVNPVAQLNAPALQDQNDASRAVPAAAYKEVDVDPALSGPNVAIVDLEQPTNTPVDLSQPPLFDRHQQQFEEVNAYFQI